MRHGHCGMAWHAVTPCLVPILALQSELRDWTNNPPGNGLQAGLALMPCAHNAAVLHALSGMVWTALQMQPNLPRASQTLRRSRSCYQSLCLHAEGCALENYDPNTMTVSTSGLHAGCRLACERGMLQAGLAHQAHLLGSHKARCTAQGTLHHHLPQHGRACHCAQVWTVVMHGPEASIYQSELTHGLRLHVLEPGAMH